MGATSTVTVSSLFTAFRKSVALVLTVVAGCTTGSVSVSSKQPAAGGWNEVGATLWMDAETRAWTNAAMDALLDTLFLARIGRVEEADEKLWEAGFNLRDAPGAAEFVRQFQREWDRGHPEIVAKAADVVLTPDPAIPVWMVEIRTPPVPDAFADGDPHLRVDPIEKDPRLGPYVTAAHLETEIRLLDHPWANQRKDAVWNFTFLKKKILRERYGIEWKSIYQMNSGIMWD